LWVGCGTEDPLYSDNERFAETCRRVGVRITTSFTPGGHDWALWDQEIQKVLAWLPLDTATA